MARGSAPPTAIEPRAGPIEVVSENNATPAPQSKPKRKRGRKVPAARTTMGELSGTELARVKGYLYSVACTEAWVESIMDMIRAKDRNGRRVIRYAVGEGGVRITRRPLRSLARIMS